MAVCDLPSHVSSVSGKSLLCYILGSDYESGFHLLFAEGASCLLNIGQERPSDDFWVHDDFLVHACITIIFLSD